MASLEPPGGCSWPRTARWGPNASCGPGVLAVTLCAILAGYAAATHRDGFLRSSLAGIGNAVAD